MLLCESAVSRGLYGFAVTDCCDCDRFDEMHFAKRLQESNYCFFKAKNVFSNELILINGIEISQPLFDIDKTNKIIKNVNYDIVLASIKKLDDGNIISMINFDELTENEINSIMEKYFSAVLKMCKNIEFDVLSQIALPLRYIDRTKIPYFTLRSYDDIIEEILKELINKNIALEINTSGIRGRLNNCLPPISITRMYHELGGKYITIGSGAHDSGSIGSDFNEGISEAYESGFDKYCYFLNHKPIMIKIR